MIEFEDGIIPYHQRMVRNLTADGEVFMRDEKVEGDRVLVVTGMCCYGNNSAANEAVDLGYTRGEINNYIAGKVNTGDVDYRVSWQGELILMPGDRALAHFEAGNNTEVLTFILHGYMRKIKGR